MPRAALLLAPLAVALAGCGGTTGKSKPVAPVAPAASLTPVAPAPPAPARPAAAESPADALRSLKEKPSSDLLTPAFVKVLTGREGGSAKWDAGIYTRGVADQLAPGEAVAAPEGAATLLVAPAGKDRLLARVVPTADGPRFDWLQLVPAGPRVGAAELPATFAAAGFLGAVTAGRDSLAAELLTPAARARLAPPRDDAQKKLGYAPAIMGLRLKSFRDRATSFVLGSVAKPGAVTATLTGSGDPRPVTLVLGKTAAGGYAVEEFRAE